MPYQVEHAGDTRAQIATLPADAHQALQAAVDQAARDPWAGQPFYQHPPEFRSMLFGEPALGLLVYVVLEPARTVALLDVVWSG